MTRFNALAAAVDALDAPLRLWVRDDDAGWADARLQALLDCMSDAGVPIELAAIPMAYCAEDARVLAARIDAAPELIRIHQHGYAHLNHEPSGRRCEFGERSIERQRADLSAGRARLQQLFGERLGATFTPPWNRVGPRTPALLAELGYRALSRDAGAPAQTSLPERPIHFDWCKQLRGARADRVDPLGRIDRAVAAVIERDAPAGAPIGLMLHHAEMDDTELVLLTGLLRQLSTYPCVRWAALEESAPA